MIRLSVIPKRRQLLKSVDAVEHPLSNLPFSVESPIIEIEVKRDKKKMTETA